MSDDCPMTKGCPIFTGALRDKSLTTQAFQAAYCSAGIEGRKNCKRFQCKEKYGKAPKDLMPNSRKSLDEIAKEANL